MASYPPHPTTLLAGDPPKHPHQLPHTGYPLASTLLSTLYGGHGHLARDPLYGGVAGDPLYGGVWPYPCIGTSITEMGHVDNPMMTPTITRARARRT